MSFLFNPNNPVMKFLEKIADLLLINIFWFICSIPIITIGASTSALYYIVLKMVNDEDYYVIKDYFKSFKENLKQGIQIWLCIFTLILIAMGIYFGVNSESIDSTIQLVLTMVLLLLILLSLILFIYSFALQAKYSNSVINTIRNALILGVIHIGKTVVMIVVDVIIVCVGLVYLPILAISIPLYINAVLLNRIFEKHFSIRKDEEEAYAD